MASFSELVDQAIKGSSSKSPTVVFTNFKVGNKVSHPEYGTGTVTAVNESVVSVNWDRLSRKMISPEPLEKEDVKYLTVVEDYSSDPARAEYEGGEEEEKDKPEVNPRMAKKTQEKKEVTETYKGKKFDLTPADMGLLFESENEPLATNDEKAQEATHASMNKVSNPSDALKIPKVKEIEDVSNGVPATKVGGSSEGGSGENPFAKKSEKSEPKSEKSEPKKDNKPAFLKKEDKSDNKSEEKKETNEALTWDDLVPVVECEDDEHGEHEPMMREHNMDAGEIALTQDLMKVLLKAVRDQKPSDEEIEAIAKGFAKGVGEDRTLDVGDISTIQARMKDFAAGEDAEEVNSQEDVGSEGEEIDGDEFHDKASGDGEVAGPEAGEDHEGKTKLMDKDEEDESEPTMESKKADKKADKKMKKAEEKKEKGKAKKKVNEAWLAAIPFTDRGTGSEVELNPNDENDEIADIARRCGIDNWQKHRNPK